MDSTARTTEELTKASQGSSMTAHDLRAALATATPVEALILLPLIARAEGLSQDIQAMLSARASAG